MGCSRDEVARVLSEVTSIFENAGLAVHGLEMSGGEMKALGVELDSRLLRTSVTRERFWRLYGGLSHLQSREKRTERCWRSSRALCVRCAGQAARFERISLCIPVHTGRVWEASGALVVGSRKATSVPRPDAVLHERQVATLESARECQRCINEWVWSVDRNVDTRGGPACWSDARARRLSRLSRCDGSRRPEW